MAFEREINYWMHMLDECYNIHLCEDGLNIEPYVQKNITYDDLNSKAAEVAKSFNENEENLTDFELAKKVAKELMEINQSIMNAIPNEDGSIMIVSM